MLTTLALSIVTASMLPPALERQEEPAKVLVEVKLHRAELEGGMDAIRSTIQNAPNVVPRGSVGGPAVFIGPSVIFTTRMGYVTEIAKPRVLTLAGQEAEIIGGEGGSYIELEGDEVRLVEMEGVYEGLRIAMDPTVLESGAIDFAAFEVTLSEVIGRVDIASGDAQRRVPIAGGRPVVRSVTYTMPLTIEPADDDEEGGSADIVFATEGDDEAVFWLSVRARVVEDE